MQLEGAGAVVFGGASGLGEASARRLSADGMDVVIADLAEGHAAALAGQLPGATCARCDVCVEEDVVEALALSTHPRVVVICAGLGTPGKLVGREGPTPLEAFERVIRVNLLGTINVLRLAAAAMQHNEPDEHGQRGVIVCTASVAAYDGQIGQIAYAASKGGVVGVTLPAARELARSGVRVMTIAPGLFETPMLAGLPQPAQDSLGTQVPHPSRLGRPDEYAQLVDSIIANPMLNGEVIRLDGAIRMAPR